MIRVILCNFVDRISSTVVSGNSRGTDSAEIKSKDDSKGPNCKNPDYKPRVAQAKYVIDHKGQYGTFRQLFEEGYLDKRFNYDQPQERGYIFVITLVHKSEGKTATFSVNANPEQSAGIGATGRNFYYLDPESGICFSKVRPATAADETL